jgi:hypothetical protein
MKVKQVSVFLENKSGRLNEVTHILEKAGINISAFTIADTSDFGILRLIVSEPEKARDILKQNSFSVQTTDVVLMQTANIPGSLAKMLQFLQDEDIFIEYMYAFSMSKETAAVVIRPTNLQKCLDVLENNDHDFLFSDGLTKA